MQREQGAQGTACSSIKVKSSHYLGKGRTETFSKTVQATGFYTSSQGLSRPILHMWLHVSLVLIKQ